MERKPLEKRPRAGAGREGARRLGGAPGRRLGHRGLRPGCSVLQEQVTNGAVAPGAAARSCWQSSPGGLPPGALPGVTAPPLPGWLRAAAAARCGGPQSCSSSSHPRPRSSFIAVDGGFVVAVAGARRFRAFLRAKALWRLKGLWDARAVTASCRLSHPEEDTVGAKPPSSHAASPRPLARRGALRRWHARGSGSPGAGGIAGIRAAGLEHRPTPQPAPGAFPARLRRAGLVWFKLNPSCLAQVASASLRVVGQQTR